MEILVPVGIVVFVLIATFTDNKWTPFCLAGLILAAVGFMGVTCLA